VEFVRPEARGEFLCVLCAEWALCDSVRALYTCTGAAVSHDCHNPLGHSLRCRACCQVLLISAQRSPSRKEEYSTCIQSPPLVDIVELALSNGAG
jgi:hypothetical protein